MSVAETRWSRRSLTRLKLPGSFTQTSTFGPRSATKTRSERRFKANHVQGSTQCDCLYYSHPPVLQEFLVFHRACVKHGQRREDFGTATWSTRIQHLNTLCGPLGRGGTHKSSRPCPGTSSVNLSFPVSCPGKFRLWIQAV